MSIPRAVLAVALAFVVSQILAVGVHGYLLGSDYAPFEGTLLRSSGGGELPWQMLFLPAAHLSFVCALVWVYSRSRRKGSLLARGLMLGVIGWLAGQVPLWLIWYAQQPWPGVLVAKQLGLELISTLIVGLVIASAAEVRRRQETSPATNLST
jgi:hypothetical protein